MVYRCAEFEIPLLYTLQISLQYFKFNIFNESLPPVKHMFSGYTIYSPIIIRPPLVISATHTIEMQSNLFIEEAKSYRFKMCIQHAFPLPP
jgi:hypothetical protein